MIHFSLARNRVKRRGEEVRTRYSVHIWNRWERHVLAGVISSEIKDRQRDENRAAGRTIMKRLMLCVWTVSYSTSSTVQDQESMALQEVRCTTVWCGAPARKFSIPPRKSISTTPALGISLTYSAHNGCTHTGTGRLPIEPNIESSNRCLTLLSTPKGSSTTDDRRM